MAKTMDTPKTPQPAGKIPVPSSKRGFKGFFNEVGRELKKVSWPSARETNRLTGIVLAVCGLLIAVLYAMSYVAATVVNILQKGF